MTEKTGQNKKLGMVFEGGANRTIFSCGVMDALLEADIMPDYMIGVSAGIAFGVSYLSRQKGRNLEVMEKYMAEDTVIYINLPYVEIANRLGNIKRRGVVLKYGQTLKDLYNERTKLYEKYCHINIKAEGLGIEELLDSVAGMIIVRRDL